jgi:glycerol uptake facilitator protein
MLTEVLVESTPSLGRRCLAELLGTFLLVFFGCGAVHAAVLTGAQSGLWQVAIVWGVAVMAAIFTVGHVSGAHISPAVTLALWKWRGFPGRDVLPYVGAHLVGAFLAAAALFGLFGSFLTAREKEQGVQRGGPGSEMTAMCYGEYYPNPGRLAGTGGDTAEQLALFQEHYGMVTEIQAFLAEFIGTMFLALAVFAVSDERNRVGMLGPVIIGLTIAMLISVIAPLTQACFNPARDFGPRLWAFLAGWGEVAIPGPNGRGIVTVYILAPLAGGLTGGAIYAWLLQPAPAPTENAS